MANSPFRKKSLEKLNDPEQLNDYIRVTNPAVWMILALIGLLLALFILWAIYGEIDIEEKTVVIAKNGESCVYVSSEYAGQLHAGLLVDGFTTAVKIVSVPAEPVQITASFNANAKSIANMENGDYYYACPIDYALDSDGIYPVTVYFDQLSPISYLFSRGA